MIIPSNHQPFSNNIQQMMQDARKLTEYSKNRTNGLIGLLFLQI